jgi:hypothetical protein
MKHCQGAAANSDELEERTITAVELLRSGCEEKSALSEVRHYLIDYAASSDAWAVTAPGDWNLGMHFIIIDHALPGQNLMLTTFSIPHGEKISDEQLAQLVKTVVSGQGSCCSSI